MAGTVASATRSLLAALGVTTAVVTGALGWAGWRLADHQRLLDEQRVRDQADSAADIVATGIRGRLAEAGERLSGWVANPSSPLPVIEDAVVVVTRGDRTDVNPPGALPYVPVVPDDGPTEPFAALEGIEVVAAARVVVGYRTLASQRDPSIRAGALLRLGRVQRRLGDLPGALVTYQRLAELGDVRTGDLPAELAGLNGQRATYLALADSQSADAVAERILHGLDAGRWSITRGAGEFYREPFTKPKPVSWRLAHALSEVWHTAGGRLPSQGYRVFADPRDVSSSVVVLWRSNGVVSAALAAPADAFFDVTASAPVAWQLTDAEGSAISGQARRPGRSVARIIGSYPWTLHAWLEPSVTSSATSRRRVLLGMMAAMLVFVWGASYSMARAIRREAAVTQLRSDFLAAVSHEFRSPLTAVRQMAEMLDANRVSSEDRRHQYYAMLASEAARLQRLVETLLDFGRMEAGAERFRFAEVDTAVLVREVVDEMEPHARELGKAIRIDGSDDGMHVRADHGALAVALRNLIDNAIKYSPGEPTVWVRWRRDRDRAAISIIDHGVGIPRSEHRRIFGKFVRGRDAIDANIAGTGVGLAIVQQIVNAHGGEIRIESEPGRGSTFTLLLPVLG